MKNKLWIIVTVVFEEMWPASIEYIYMLYKFAQNQPATIYIKTPVYFLHGVSISNHLYINIYTYK